MEHPPLKTVACLFIACFTAIFSIGAQNNEARQNFESLFPDQDHGYISCGIPPVIGAWFWGEEQFEPGGYKEFIDDASKHSLYNLLTTGFRVRGRDITDIDNRWLSVNPQTRFARQ